MIDHVWTVLCTRSSIDRETNNMSLFEAIEQLTIHDWTGQPGFAPGPFELVSLWARAETDRPCRGEARFLLRTPGGRTAISQTHEVDLRQYRRLRTRRRIPAIPVDGAGLYTFLVELRELDQDQWLQVARIPLEVQVQAAVPQEPPTQAQTA